PDRPRSYRDRPLGCLRGDRTAPARHPQVAPVALLLPFDLEALGGRRAPDRLARAARVLPRILRTPLARVPPGALGCEPGARVRRAAMVARHDDAHARRAAVVWHVPLLERHDFLHPRAGRRDATRTGGARPDSPGVRGRVR